MLVYKFYQLLSVTQNSACVHVMRPSPKSCDTFVHVTKDKVFFGKNSDRPQDENQNVVFIPRQKHTEAELKCTYITVQQVPETYALVLCQVCPKLFLKAKVPAVLVVGS